MDTAIVTTGIAALSAIALVAGLLAARYWSLSTKVQVAPTNLGWALPGTGGPIEPVLADLKALDMSVANMRGHQATIDAFAKSGHLNHVAAWLSGVSAAASFAAAMLGVYATLKL